MAWPVVQVVVQRWSGSRWCGLCSKVRWWVARESDLGQSLGLGAQQWRCGTAGGGLCQILRDFPVDVKTFQSFQTHVEPVSTFLTSWRIPLLQRKVKCRSVGDAMQCTKPTKSPGETTTCLVLLLSSSWGLPCLAISYESNCRYANTLNFITVLYTYLQLYIMYNCTYKLVQPFQINWCKNCSLDVRSFLC